MEAWEQTKAGARPVELGSKGFLVGQLQDEDSTFTATQAQDTNQTTRNRAQRTVLGKREGA